MPPLPPSSQESINHNQFVTLSLFLRNSRHFGATVREYSVFMSIPTSPAEKSAARRAASKSVREARDRLTSTSGTRPAFDYELLRQFAQNRLSGSLVVIVLVASIGVLSGLWTGALTAGVWTAAMLLIQLIILMVCKRFIDTPQDAIDIKTWRFRFVLLDLFFGLAWMFNLIQ